MNNINGRHWVFIVGFILAAVVSVYSPTTARGILDLLLFIGLGIFLNDTF